MTLDMSVHLQLECFMNDFTDEFAQAAPVNIVRADVVPLDMEDTDVYYDNEDNVEKGEENEEADDEEEEDDDDTYQLSDDYHDYYASKQAPMSSFERNKPLWSSTTAPSVSSTRKLFKIFKESPDMTTTTTTATTTTAASISFARIGQSGPSANNRFDSRRMPSPRTSVGFAPPRDYERFMNMLEMQRSKFPVEDDVDSDDDHEDDVDEEEGEEEKEEEEEPETAGNEAYDDLAEEDLEPVEEYEYELKRADESLHPTTSPLTTTTPVTATETTTIAITTTTAIQTTTPAVSSSDSPVDYIEYAYMEYADEEPEYNTDATFDVEGEFLQHENEIDYDDYPISKTTIAPAPVVTRRQDAIYQRRSSKQYFNLKSKNRVTNN